MSLSSLSKDIQHCSQDMDQQRLYARQLLNRQKNEFCQRLEKIPLPVAIGLALVGGFLSERIFHYPTSSQMFHLFLTWRAL